MFIIKKIILATMFCGVTSTWVLPSYADDLDTALRNDINTYVAKYSATEGNTAIQLSVLLPNEPAPRDYIAGKQMKENDVPATTNMLLQWGSITKEFTSLLIFQYLNKNQIDPQQYLDKTLYDVLPEHFDTSDNAWPGVWKVVTIKQLMNMTSGIPEYIGLPGVDPYRVTDLASIVAPVAIYQNRRGCQVEFGCFPAGQGWNYSNTDYIILGMLVEKLYGANFSDVIQKQVLSVMQRVGNNVIYQTPYTANTLQNMINGYSMGGWFPWFTFGQNVTNVNLNIAASAGALTGNTHALVETIHALFHDQFLPHEQMQYFMNNGWIRRDTHQPIDINSDTAKKVCTNLLGLDCYGLGFLVTYDSTYGQMWEYPGGTMGYVTDYIWLPQENVVIGFSRNSGANVNNLLITFRAQILQDVYHHLHAEKQ